MWEIVDENALITSRHVRLQKKMSLAKPKMIVMAEILGEQPETAQRPVCTGPRGSILGQGLARGSVRFILELI